METAAGNTILRGYLAVTNRAIWPQKATRRTNDPCMMGGNDMGNVKCPADWNQTGFHPVDVD